MFIPPAAADSDPRHGFSAAHAMATKLHATGVSSEKIALQLLQLGIDQINTTRIRSDVIKRGVVASKGSAGSEPGPSLEELVTKATREAGFRNVVLGVIILMGGLTATIAIFLIASVAGSPIYFITTGAIIFGVAQIVRGARQLAVRNKRAS